MPPSVVRRNPDKVVNYAADGSVMAGARPDGPMVRQIQRGSGVCHC